MRLTNWQIEQMQIRNSLIKLLGRLQFYVHRSTRWRLRLKKFLLDCYIFIKLITQSISKFKNVFDAQLLMANDNLFCWIFNNQKNYF